MRIIREESIGLIIDIQERLFPFIHENELVLKNTSTLIKGLQAVGIPILVTQQYTKGLGSTLQPLKDALGTEEYIEKMAFSCCDDNGFMAELKKLNRRFVIVAGIESHVCVLQTVIDLLESDFQPVVVEDCISSRNLNDKLIAVARMRSEGAIITTYESLLFEVLRYSGTPEFKEISKLVK
jgi:nicotinamidase-related amidase